jgi:hypothetical protein
LYSPFPPGRKSTTPSGVGNPGVQPQDLISDDGGETKPENLVLLCRHHHRFIHEGGCRLEPTAGGFQFLMPDGTPLPAMDSFLEATELEALVDRNAEFDIRWDTSRTQYYCGRPDYFSTIDTLFSDKQRAKRTPGHFEMSG